MKKSYTLSDYARDKKLVQTAEQLKLDRLDVYSKIALLKDFGYENLKGGLSGLPAKEMALDLLLNILNDRSLLESMLVKRQNAIEPENPLSPGDLSQLVEESLGMIVSRVNQAFEKTYDSARKRVEKYEAGEVPIQGTLPPTQPPQPQPARPLEKRVEQEQPKPRPRQQQLPGIPPYQPPEESYFTPSGKKKRRRRN